MKRKVETSTDRFFNFDVHLTSILTRDVFLGHTFVSLVIDRSIQEELYFSFSSPLSQIDLVYFFRLRTFIHFNLTNSILLINYIRSYNNHGANFSHFHPSDNKYSSRPWERGKQKENSFLFERILNIYIYKYVSIVQKFRWWS